MQRFELMVVEDAFDIKSVGVLLSPSFDLPPHGKWQTFNETVSIQLPNGELIEADARFSAIHLNISDPTVGANKRWQIVASFKNLTKNEVPVGSKVFVSSKAMEAIKGVRA